MGAANALRNLGIKCLSSSTCSVDDVSLFFLPITAGGIGGGGEEGRGGGGEEGRGGGGETRRLEPDPEPEPEPDPDPDPEPDPEPEPDN